MQDYVARLIDCGVPRLTAVFLCRYFTKQGKVKELEKYVEAVEAECRVYLDDV